LVSFFLCASLPLSEEQSFLDLMKLCFFSPVPMNEEASMNEEEFGSSNDGMGT
jgi:hypothetical protein